MHRFIKLTPHPDGGTAYVHAERVAVVKADRGHTSILLSDWHRVAEPVDVVLDLVGANEPSALD